MDRSIVNSRVPLVNSAAVPRILAVMEERGGLDMFLFDGKTEASDRPISSDGAIQSSSVLSGLPEFPAPHVSCFFLLSSYTFLSFLTNLMRSFR